MVAAPFDRVGGLRFPVAWPFKTDMRSTEDSAEAGGTQEMQRNLTSDVPNPHFEDKKKRREKRGPRATERIGADGRGCSWHQKKRRPSSGRGGAGALSYAAHGNVLYLSVKMQLKMKESVHLNMNVSRRNIKSDV